MQLLQRANFNGTNGNQFFLDLYQDNSQSVEGNTSTVRYYAYVGSSGNYSGGGASSPVYINGQHVGSFSNIGPNSNTLIGYLDVTYQHDTQGNAVADYSARADTNWNLGDAIINDSTFPLPTIPRADSIIGPTNLTIGKTTTINISQNSTSFRHKLRYDFGTLSEEFATNVANSYQWTVPETFYAQIPNNVSGQGIFYCYTYSGNDLIGTTTTPFTVHVDSDEAKPTVSFGYTTDVISQSLTGYVDGIVKGVSNINYTITGTAKHNSTISKYYLSKVSGALQETQSTGSISKVDSDKLYTSVKDSRGLSSDTLQVDFEHYVEYIPLEVTNMSLSRENELSSKVYLSLTGDYFNDSFGATNNALTVQLRYKEKGTSVWGETSDITTEAVILNNTFSITDLLIGENFLTDVSYDIEVILKDKVNTTGITYSKTLSEGTPTFRIRKNDVWYKGIKLLEYADSQIKINVDLVHPVGSLYFSTDPTNPSQIFGGTWIAWGAGRVPIGVNSSDTLLNASEKTGGSINPLSEHSHLYRLRATTLNGNVGNKSIAGYNADIMSNNTMVIYDEGNGNSAGDNSNHNNWQPYITCYIWKRTA